MQLPSPVAVLNCQTLPFDSFCSGSPHEFENEYKYVVQLEIKDKSGEINVSNTLIQVVPELTLAKLSTPINIDQGQNYTYNAIATNGTTPYSYSWNVIGLLIKAGCGIATSNAFCTVTGNSIGNGKQVSVTVTDLSAGTPPENATRTATVNVHGLLAVKPPTSSHSLVDRGQLSVESSSVVGGTPPYETYWAWELPGNLTYVNIAGSSQVSNSVITQVLFPTNVLTPIGDWEFQVFVVDASNALPEMANAINQEGVTVYPQLTANATANPIQVILGNSSTLTGSTSGGSNPSNLACQWFEEAPGSATFTSIGGATNCNIYTFSTTSGTTKGTWTFKMQVTDTGTTVFEVINSTSTFVTVGQFGVALTGSSPVIDSGQTEVLTATAQGGTPPYTYTWTGSDRRPYE